MARSSSPRSALTLPRAGAMLVALALLGGCTTTGRDRFPSLARRPAERSFAVAAGPSSEPSAIVLPPLGPDPLPRADALVAQAQEADDRFAARESAAAQRIAAGRNAARGSEAWAVAQIALAELESARSRATVAMADLDRLLVESTIGDAQVADPRLPALRQRHAAVSALLAREDARIAGLQAALAE